MFHVKHHIKIRQSWLRTTSHRQLKSFSVQQFFKNAAEVWASSPHLRSKSNCTMKCNKNLGENRKESQLPSKSEGCNEIQGFRGNCDSQGKLGMCPSLAEPDSGGFPRTSRRRIKSFSVQQFFKNAAEVWASSPHLRSKSNCTMKCNKNLGENRKESQLPSKSEGCNEIQGFRGNCDSLGKLGMCPSLAEPDSGDFPRSNVSRETLHDMKAT